MRYLDCATWKSTNQKNSSILLEEKPRFVSSENLLTTSGFGVSACEEIDRSAICVDSCAQQKVATTGCEGGGVTRGDRE